MLRSNALFWSVVGLGVAVGGGVLAWSWGAPPSFVWTGPVVFGVGLLAVQALDLLGHVINGRKLKEADRRLTAAEERGVRVEAALARALAQFEPSPEGTDPASATVRDRVDALLEVVASRRAFAGGAVDPGEARAKVEEKKAERAEVRNKLLAALAERTGDLDLARWVLNEADKEGTLREALKNPHKAEGILGPLVILGKKLAGKGGVVGGGATATAADLPY